MGRIGGMCMYSVITRDRECISFLLDERNNFITKTAMQSIIMATTAGPTETGIGNADVATVADFSVTPKSVSTDGVRIGGVSCSHRMCGNVRMTHGLRFLKMVNSATA